jgi:hypothetical protein
LLIEEDNTLMWIFIGLCALAFFWPSLLELTTNATGIDSDQFVILQTGSIQSTGRKKRNAEAKFELDTKAELNDLVRSYSRALSEEGCVKKLACQMANSSKAWGLQYYVRRLVDVLPGGPGQLIGQEALIASENGWGCTGFTCDPMKYVNNGNELYY